MKWLCTQHGSVAKRSSNYCYFLVNLFYFTVSEDITQHLQQWQQQQQQLSVSVYMFQCAQHLASSPPLFFTTRTQRNAWTEWSVIPIKLMLCQQHMMTCIFPVYNSIHGFRIRCMLAYGIHIIPAVMTLTALGTTLHSITKWVFMCPPVYSTGTHMYIIMYIYTSHVTYFHA